MTVGLELERLTGFRLFHNHMTADLVMRLFPFDSAPYRRLVREFRRRIFEEYVENGANGLIFTFVWVLDDPEDRAFIDRTTELFTSRGANVCYVELAASQSERLRRNATPLRMAEKWPKRDVEGSRAYLLKADQTYQMNSRGSFFYPERYLKIDSTTLEPDVVARRIAAHFSLLPERAG